MMTAGEIRKWLKQFKDDEFIAVDEGGLTLVSADNPASWWCEVGGIPEEEEEENEI